MYDLDRFKKAQERDYKSALEEMINGKKRSHWIWYIFPQLRGLGHSDTAIYYGISGKKEAIAYYGDELLHARLTEISTALIQHKEKTISNIMGHPDDRKVGSCMTLFASLPNADPVFEKALNIFFRGEKDLLTINMLHRE